MKYVYNVFLLLTLQGCTIVANFLGASPSIIQAAQVADMAKLTVDVASAAERGQTTTDRLVSIVMDMECKSTYLLKGEKYCERVCR